VSDVLSGGKTQELQEDRQVRGLLRLERSQPGLVLVEEQKGKKAGKKTGKNGSHTDRRYGNLITKNRRRETLADGKKGGNRRFRCGRRKKPLGSRRTGSQIHQTTPRGKTKKVRRRKKQLRKKGSLREAKRKGL